MAPGHLRLLPLLLLFAPPALSSKSFSPDDQALELNLYHRYIPPVLAPSTPLPKFRKRGFVNVNLAENSAVLVEEGEGGAIELGLKSDGEYRYQIAVPKTLKGAKSVIGGGGDDDESVWSIVEHTVCIPPTMTPPTTEQLSLLFSHHQTPSSSSNPTYNQFIHISSYTSDHSATGKNCLTSSTVSPPSSRRSSPTSQNFTVVIKRPDVPPAPILHQPKILEYDQSGTAVPPPPEKSFIQKYWYYLIPVVFILITGAAGPEEGQQGQGGQGGGRPGPGPGAGAATPR